MKTMFKFAAVVAAVAAAPAFAQVAVADLNAAVEQSAAYQAAQSQIKTTYASQISAFNTRNQAIVNELQPMQAEIEKLQGTQGTPPATLQSKITIFRNKQQAAQAELQRLAAPFGRPTAYAQEQVADKLEAATRAAMAAKNVTVVLQPQAALLVLPAGDITADIVTQLNTLVKTVSITPPANWQPGQQRNGAGPAPTNNPQGR
jgi:Skp family chaperone for outer membrane proteins